MLQAVACVRRSRRHLNSDVKPVVTTTTYQNVVASERRISDHYRRQRSSQRAKVRCIRFIVNAARLRRVLVTGNNAMTTEHPPPGRDANPRCLPSAQRVTRNTSTLARIRPLSGASTSWPALVSLGFRRYRRLAQCSTHRFFARRAGQ
jgi:hypothetical protein